MASDRGVRARKGWVHLMPGSKDTRELWGADRAGNGGYCRRFRFLRRSPWVSRPGCSI